jgi:hypothetical protein
MCYNCGCGLPDDDMGKGKVSKGGGSLTEADFEFMAKKWDMSLESTKKETLKLLKKQLGEK